MALLSRSQSIVLDGKRHNRTGKNGVFSRILKLCATFVKAGIAQLRHNNGWSSV